MVEHCSAYMQDIDVIRLVFEYSSYSYTMSLPFAFFSEELK